MKFAAVALERLAIVLASLAVSVGLIALLSGFFTGRDQAGIAGDSGGPGQAYRDLGHSLLRPGEHPVYDSVPPTSGAHIPEPVTKDAAALNDNQLLQALELGDVVIMYGTRAPPPGLSAFAGSVAAPFSPALAAAGQAVILARRSGTASMTGLAWGHLVRVSGPQDPLLREFVAFWLGRGAPRREHQRPRRFTPAAAEARRTAIIGR